MQIKLAVLEISAIFFALLHYALLPSATLSTALLGISHDLNAAKLNNQAEIIVILFG